MIRIGFRYLVVAVLLAGVAVGMLVLGRLERRVAEADRDLATLNLGRAAQGYRAVADALAWTTGLPWPLRQTKDEVALGEAAVRYWRGDYTSLVTDYTSPDSPSIADNVDLQFVVANAAYRSTQRPDANREMALGALDRAASVYRRLLEANEGYRDAAFNYELVLRWRSRIAAGAPIPPVRRPTVPGTQGDEPEEEDMEDVQIYVPRDRLVEPEETDDPTIGEGAPIRKRG